jgi:hypothetical protein
MTPAGFPHSDISGSTPACDSPELFAANHVLHRLLTPRHSPCALSSLVTNFSANRDESRSALNLASATFSIAIRRLQGRVLLNTRSPLTLDCFVRVTQFERCTQDTLSRRRLLFSFQRAENRKSCAENADPSRSSAGGA